MTEVVISAIVGEIVHRMISRLVGKDEKKSEEREGIERLEMAHIKMEAALQKSGIWQIRDVPLLRWRRKLKRAAEECNDTLRKCKQRALQEEVVRQHVSQSSFPKRIAHSTKLFASSFIGSNNDELSSLCANVRRFERYADGADGFLKFVEFGGTPRQYMFFNPLISHLLSGKSMRYQAFQESKFCYIGIRPISFADRGVEAMIGFACKDFGDPTKGFNLGFMLRISESTDIFGAIIKCMESVTPHFMFAAEAVKRELIQLPTQDFSWVPHSPSEGEYWINVHSTLTQWYRPDPLCCNTAVSPSRQMSNMFPEEVISVFLQCRVLPSDDQKKSIRSLTAEHGVTSSSLNPDMPSLKLGVLFIPHDSTDDIDTADENYALEVIGKEVQEMVHRNVCPQDIDAKLMAKAMDYLYQNKGSRMYQICLKSRHGTANICVEKMRVHNKGKTSRSGVRDKRAVQHRDHYSVAGWKDATRDLSKLWVMHSSDQMQGSTRSWCVLINIKGKALVNRL